MEIHKTSCGFMFTTSGKMSLGDFSKIAEALKSYYGEGVTIRFVEEPKVDSQESGGAFTLSVSRKADEMTLHLGLYNMTYDKCVESGCIDDFTEHFGDKKNFPSFFIETSAMDKDNFTSDDIVEAIMRWA